MTENPNPISEPDGIPASGPSGVGAFKKRAAGTTLGLPSGLSVIAHRVQLKTFLKTGQVPNGLVPIIEAALNQGKEIDLDVDNLDMKQLTEMYEMTETVAMASVISPKFHPNPEMPFERRDDIVYIDEVDDEDKMFIFQWATGGTADIATFRAEASAGMAPLAKG